MSSLLVISAHAGDFPLRETTGLVDRIVHVYRDVAPSVVLTHPQALDAAQARVNKEEASREAFRDGELGLDRYGLRAKLAELGVQYVTAEESISNETGNP
jgi:hypothetical protein